MKKLKEIKKEYHQYQIEQANKVYQKEIKLLLIHKYHKKIKKKVILRFKDLKKEYLKE